MRVLIVGGAVVLAVVGLLLVLALARAMASSDEEREAEDRIQRGG